MYNFNFEIGDNVYCYKGSRGLDRKLTHKKGKSYKILNIEETFDIPWSGPIWHKYFSITIENENNDYELYWCIDKVNDENTYYLAKSDNYIFSEHFLSLKEYRNLKLEKLKGL